MKPLQATVTHQLPCAPDEAFDAFLDPGKISQFMFGPRLRDETVIHIKNDPRVGGKFSFLVERGGHEIDHVGEYLEIEKPTHLEFTWGTRQDATSSRVIIDFVKNQSGTEVTLTHEIHPDWADFVDKAKQAWSKMINLLAEIQAPRH